MKKPLVTYFQAEDGSLYAGVQEYNGKISQLSQVAVKTNLIENVLDATLLIPERSKMVSTLVGEIFLMDSFAWLAGFIVAFAGLATGQPPLLPPVLSIVLSCTAAGLVIVAQMWNAVAPRLYISVSGDNGGGGGFWVSSSSSSSSNGSRVTRNTLVFAVFLVNFNLLGLWYTVQTGSTLFARACLVQWAMSLGTILAIFKPRPPIRSQDIQASPPPLPDDASAGETEARPPPRKILIPGLLVGLLGSSLLAWIAGVVAEPHLGSAFITLLPIPLCVAYRYLWIVYMVVIPEEYRSDETVLAWSDFYFEILRRITLPSARNTTLPPEEPVTDTAKEDPALLLSQ
jgi:hypothetical protein